MKLTIRDYREQDVEKMIHIWNEVVDEGKAFPQEEFLTMETGRKFFASQTLTRAAVVSSNIHARHLYERLGFREAGKIPGGFRMKDGRFEEIVLYYYLL